MHASSPVTADVIFSPLVEKAIELAAQWHERTYRKGRWRQPPFETPVDEVLRVPIMAHLTAVALTVQRAGWDDETVAAAFLHDAIEDANRHGQELRREMLEQVMGETVTAIVEGVSEQKRDAAGAFRSWRARKEDYVAQLRAGRPEAAAISLADKLHNLWTVNESLERDIDVFSSTEQRRGLSAGPAEQRWFHRAVLEATAGFDDPRLEALRARLEEEIERFEAFLSLQ